MYCVADLSGSAMNVGSGRRSSSKETGRGRRRERTLQSDNPEYVI